MIENDSGPPRGPDSDALLYDWFKHLTSLSLLTLGGVLSLSQIAKGDSFYKWGLLGSLIAVGLAAVLAFTGASQIVRSRASSTPLPAGVLAYEKGAEAALALGVGAFLYIFVKATI
ncbi:MAG TPA: hypothetical protein VGB70_05330 [Allosphingosinicella sp.]|jgi:hypothetical protein